MTELPAGWVWRRLGDLAEEVRGSVTPTEGAPYELWSIPAFAQGRPEWVDGADIGSTKRPVQEGDVLVAKINPRINRVWTVTTAQADRQQIASPEWLVLRVPAKSSEVTPGYLRWYLSSPRFRDWITRAVSGVTGSHTRAKSHQMLNQRVPVAPLGEQRRIVEILEDHLSRLDAAGGMLRGAISRVRTWHRGSVDRILWSSRQGEDTEMAPVGSLLGERMRNGHSARASKSGAGVRTLTLTAVTRNDFSDQFTKMTTADVDRVEDLWLQPGDILVQRANTAELVGTTAIYQGDPGWAIFPDLLIRLRADSGQISPSYLAAALQTERAHRALRAKAKGLAGSMPKIDQAAISDIRVPVPNRSEQQRRVEQVEAVDASRDALLADLDRAIKRAGTLRRALLDAAFSGGLT